MSASTEIATGGLTTFSVKVGGTTIPDETRVLSIMVDKAVNRIATARITVIDGDVTKGTFEASSSSTFIPGDEVVIEAGYDTKNSTIFKGIITGQTIRIDELLGSALIIECRDVAVKMTVGRKSLTFSNKTDSDIMSSILGKYSDMTTSVSTTTTEWPQQVQYYTTDWDYVLSRAEANGMIVTTINGTLSIQKPNDDTTSVLELEYGNNLLEFNADLDAISQLGAAKASTWDYKSQEITDGESSNDYAGPGNLSSKTLSEVVGLSDYVLQTSAPLEQSDLTNWSKAALIKSEYAKIQGTARFRGTSEVDPAKYITLAGLGDRFNGDHLISRVIHTIENGRWTTLTHIGLSNIWFTEEPNVMAPPASGLLPGARGLFNGTVKKMYEDPDNQFRILVDVPLFDQNGEGIWARLTNFYSTNGAGVFFLPEVGDEVIIGFLNEDPRFPIILGSLYSSDKVKPFEGLNPNEKNSMKAIVSKSGIYLEFDDENKVLTITTPEKNTVILSDKDKQISIEDQNNNSIVMSNSGIVMKSEKDISIEASQSLTLKGDQGVTIESSTGDVSTSGMNVKTTADTQYSVNGGETAQINSSAELTINSGMIMIN